MGLNLKWNYKKRTLETSADGYVKNALHHLQHPPPTKPQHAPAKAKPIQYGAKIQTNTVDNSKPLCEKGIKRIQKAVGTFIWYGNATDPTMARTLSSIANRQDKATEQLKAETEWFLDYCHTHPDARVRFVASDMILTLHSDCSFNSEPGSKSRAAGHWYLSKKDNHNLSNGAIMTLSKIIKYVMSSAGEGEAASSYMNARAALPLRIALEEMGHPQPQTPVIMDNTSAIGLAESTMRPKRSKAYDMRVNWMKCREAQKHFKLIWEPGKGNLADYHSKIHTSREYQNKRKDFVQN